MRKSQVEEGPELQTGYSRDLGNSHGLNVCIPTTTKIHPKVNGIRKSGLGVPG